MTKRLLLSDRLAAIIEIVPVTIKELSIALNYDASYLSRIRSGKRNPQDPELFAFNLCQYIIRSATPEQTMALMELCGCSSEQNLAASLGEWMVEREAIQNSGLDHFLKNIDEFDLNEFIRSVSIHENNVPLPEETDHYCIYHGTEAIRQAELDFFSSVLASDSTEPVFMCNNLPIDRLTSDVDYIKTWMGMVSECIRKGIRFQVVHFVNRPSEEMMLGLEGWIPLYMTGRITPWYLPVNEHTAFRQCLYLSGKSVLRGECFGNHLEHSMYELFTAPEWISYGRKRSQDILSLAKPLMKIFMRENHDQYNEHMKKSAAMPGSRRICSCSLPISSLTSDVLKTYLESAGIAPDIIAKIEEYRRRELSVMHLILRSGTIVFEIPNISEEEFANHTPSLFLAPMMLGLSIPYTKEFYQKPLQLTHEFAETNPGFSLVVNPESSFRNISMIIQNDVQAIIMKNRSPEICFVISHPRLLHALSNYSPVIQDD
jgi:hypothetical protein